MGQPHRAGTSSGASELAQLPLVAFLNASPSPSLVLALAPLVHALRTRQSHPALVSPTKTPLWNGHAAPVPQTGATRTAGSGIGGDEGKGAFVPTTASPDTLPGMVELLNVKTPVANAVETPATSGGDYFSLTADIQPPPAVSSSSLSSVSTASTSSSINSLASFSSPTGDKPITPLTDVDDLDTAMSSLPTFSPVSDPRQVLLEKLLPALHPVYRNEAWRNLEATTRRNSAATRPSLSGPTVVPRARARWNRRSGSGGARTRRTTEEDDSLMTGAMPAGFSQPNSRVASPLGTVEEEETSGMDKDEEDGASMSGLDETDYEDDDEPESAYAFLAPEDHTALLAFVLDLVEDMELSTPTLGAHPYSPGSVSPTSTPASGGEAQYSSTGSGLPRSNFSFGPAPRISGRLGARAPHTCRLDDFVISATICPTPGSSSSFDITPTHPQSASSTGTTGFLILTIPPPTPPLNLTTWPPRSTNLTIRSSRTASTQSSCIFTTAAPPTNPMPADTSLGNVYQSPSAEAAVKLQSLHPPHSPTSLPVDSLPRQLTDPWFACLGETEMGLRIRNHPWHETAVGPIESWPPELRTMVSSILASPFRECILWGPEYTILYNDHYVETAGEKHPALLGLPCKEGWKEIWDGLDGIAKRTMAGETCFFRDHYLAMERLGFVEETYHTFSYAPFYSHDGKALGILNLSIETTATVIAARHLATVRDLVSNTSLARTVDDFAECALRSLANNPYDLPFVALYTVSEVDSKPTKKEVRAGYNRSNRRIIKLENRGTTGIPEGHPFLIHEALVDITPPKSRQSSSSASTGTGSTATMRDRLLDAATLSPASAAGSPAAPSSSSGSSGSISGFSAHAAFLRCEEAANGWSWPLEEACVKRDPVLVEDLGPLAETLDRSRGWSYPARQAVVLPVFVEANQVVPAAVLVLGVNSMGRYDHLLETFHNLVARHVAIGLFAVLAAEQDRKRAEELVRLDRAKSSFFSSISHELRTPLTLILGPLEDILSGSEKEKLDPSQRDKLQLVQRHSNRLLTMVNKLLDFSSIEGGRMNFKYRPVQIGALTRDIAVLFRDAIERTKIKYTVECDDDPADCLPIYMSPDIWEKICFNLIGNSFKYCIKGEITVTLRSTRAEAVLSVKDTGIGIPESELGKIFERFHRIEANSRMATGTGIGLALTLELVKLVGGQLEVESELGKGSIFTVRLQRGHTHLPIEQVDHTPEDTDFVAQFQNRNLAFVEDAASWRYDAEAEAALEIVPMSSDSSTAGTVAGSEQGNSSGSGSGEDYLSGPDVLSLKNRTVVLVDDSRDLRTYISSLLSKHFNVVAFADPREALNYINSTPPSLVLTDAMMPYISGRELTSIIRRNPQTALIPIIMVSAQAGTEARAEALEGGVDDYLAKPFQARELLARVRVHLQLGLMRVELERRVEERTRALIESEARNRALAERYSMLSTVSPVGVIQISPKGEILYGNPRWYEIVGMPINRPLSEWTEWVTPDDQPKVMHLWKLATEGGTADTSERQFRFTNGRWAQLEIRASTEVGLPDGYVGALTDITRQKEVEMLHIREVEQRAADAEENRRNTEMFLDMSSHELRNPLSGVWQNAEVVSASLERYVELLDNLRQGQSVSHEELDDLYNEMLENIEAVESIILCASHQGRIADDILNVSKLNMGLLTVNLMPFELVSRMKDVLRAFEVECSQKSIALRLRAGDSVKALGAEWIRADPSRLHQILLNFLTNSIKYTADSSDRRIVVHIEAFETQPPVNPQAMRVSQPPPTELANGVWVVVAVEDTGRGLSEEELKRLFARFSQAKPSSDQYGGSGLGLYVSKKLVELHRGFIEVQSKLGVGSVFSFAIPAERASPPADPVAIPTVPALAMVPTARSTKRPHTASNDVPKANKSTKISQSPRPEAEDGRPIRILVVEDNLINQKVLLRQLKNAGYDVTVVNNGQEAVDALAADAKQTSEATSPNLFAAVIMDVQMPVKTGLEAVRELREWERTGQISHRYPVCAVTGNAREAQQSECLAAGYDDVATKPYRLEDVLAKISKMTGLPTPKPSK
ncbi:hypothetical protein NBRC10512_002748 [Rhodotorula toruloides]|uniref:histidine kinase n=2 Tax=Rhodotorula toruloides TaxID=5286 RepID=A0A061B8Y3_RHOTO|nr:two-component system, OmpR family, sensor histidine kinase VicK [Rhodotorula toruloides NP11]EMS21567.1 two-component system, OmpR family, sensor histidine kinase VicK [Rhodotorula toruloides NP11]CDR45834.1 RHTO0S11e05358g1_1 [Rhodotorula toruloides]